MPKQSYLAFLCLVLLSFDLQSAPLKRTNVSFQYVQEEATAAVAITYGDEIFADLLELEVQKRPDGYLSAIWRRFSAINEGFLGAVEAIGRNSLEEYHGWYVAKHLVEQPGIAAGLRAGDNWRYTELLEEVLEQYFESIYRSAQKQHENVNYFV